MKNIVFFTGAGISKESGIETFRDGDKTTALWEKYDVNQVATLDGWNKNNQLVLDFYNERHLDLMNYEPNEAHKLIAELEENHMVKVITQNIDDLHERGGSSDVLHLHGELTKKRVFDTNEIVDWGKTEILKADDGYRPHVVWFGEYPYNVVEANKAISEADYLFVIGTSLEIGYTLALLGTVSKEAKVYLINPTKVEYLKSFIKDINYVTKGATEGLKEIIEQEEL